MKRSVILLRAGKEKKEREERERALRDDYYADLRRRSIQEGSNTSRIYPLIKDEE